MAMKYNNTPQSKPILDDTVHDPARRVLFQRFFPESASMLLVYSATEWNTQIPKMSVKLPDVKLTYPIMRLPTNSGPRADRGDMTIQSSRRADGAKSAFLHGSGDPRFRAAADCAFVFLYNLLGEGIRRCYTPPSTPLLLRPYNISSMRDKCHSKQKICRGQRVSEAYSTLTNNPSKPFFSFSCPSGKVV